MPVKNTAASTSAVSVVRPLYVAQGSVKSLECVEYPELGMEAIWKIEVEDFRRLSLWMIKEMTSSSRYNSHNAPAV
ncbi:fumarate hydratase C-terminal domain-containing protein [Escherichia coli]